MAVTGHNGEPGILGTVISLISLENCMVFDHLTKTTILPGLNMGESRDRHGLTSKKRPPGYN